MFVIVSQVSMAFANFVEKEMRRKPTGFRSVRKHANIAKNGKAIHLRKLLFLVVGIVRRRQRRFQFVR